MSAARVTKLARLGCRRMQCRSDGRRRSGGCTGWAWRGWPRRSCRDRAGVSMFEFSLIALPLFILLYCTFEFGFVYWANQELEHAAPYGARLVRTGQVQSGGLDRTQLTSQICSQTGVLVA